MTDAHAIEPLYMHQCRISGVTHFVSLFPAGLTIGMRPSKRGRLIQWSEIETLSECPPADRYGVVVDGRLLAVLDNEADANDRAANLRTLGSSVDVIRVPSMLST